MHVKRSHQNYYYLHIAIELVVNRLHRVCDVFVAVTKKRPVHVTLPTQKNFHQLIHSLRSSQIANMPTLTFCGSFVPKQRQKQGLDV